MGKGLSKRKNLIGTGKRPKRRLFKRGGLKTKIRTGFSSTRRAGGAASIFEEALLFRLTAGPSDFTSGSVIKTYLPESIFKTPAVDKGTSSPRLKGVLLQGGKGDIPYNTDRKERGFLFLTLRRKMT